MSLAQSLKGLGIQELAVTTNGVTTGQCVEGVARGEGHSSVGVIERKV